MFHRAAQLRHHGHLRVPITPAANDWQAAERRIRHLALLGYQRRRRRCVRILYGLRVRLAGQGPWRGLRRLLGRHGARAAPGSGPPQLGRRDACRPGPWLRNCVCRCSDECSEDGGVLGARPVAVAGARSRAHGSPAAAAQNRCRRDRHLAVCVCGRCGDVSDAVAATALSVGRVGLRHGREPGPRPHRRVRSSSEHQRERQCRRDCDSERCCEQQHASALDPRHGHPAHGRRCLPAAGLAVSVGHDSAGCSCCRQCPAQHEVDRYHLFVHSLCDRVRADGGGDGENGAACHACEAHRQRREACEQRPQ